MKTVKELEEENEALREEVFRLYDLKRRYNEAIEKLEKIEGIINGGD